ncbi:MAG: DHH family phosphoesterase [Nitrospirae bacterium]|nr:DHH family phosphoesterase [Nitrospirota bacterium]
MKSSQITTKQHINKLLGIFKKEDCLLILIEPDPDSIASAMILKRILWRIVSKVSIAYFGKIQRLDNQVMVESVKAPLIKMAKINSADFTRFALIDSQPHHSELFKDFKFDIIIDHHPHRNKPEASYVDIRPEYGATATIMTEYLRAAKIVPSKTLATAILYAIKTDTSNFERGATAKDIEQFQYVFHYANRSLLSKIERSELRIADLTLYRKAIKNMTITRNKVFSYLGVINAPDICVQLADFFMRIHKISWSITAGLYNETLIIIFRSDGQRKDAGKLAIKSFAAIGSAGGHKGAARAEVPIDNIKTDRSDKEIEAFLRNRLNI